MFESYRDEFNRMRELMTELPTFVPMEHIQQELIPGTLYTLLLNTLLFFSCIWVLQQSKQKRKKPESSSSSSTDAETAYLITTAFFNLLVGLLGLYYYIAVMEHPATVDAMILGYRAMYPLSCVQLAKNLFAIPVGLTLIHEKVEMMLHHIAVLFVVCVSASMTAGFTYFSPIVYGLLEISSVPLAIMNYFKLNPEYITAYPKVYSNVRLAFGLSFLAVRWGLSLPSLLVMIRLIFYRAITLAQDGKYVLCVVLTSCVMATSFLTFLQVYWGLLIVKSVVKGPPPAKSSATTTTSKND